MKKALGGDANTACCL